MYCDFPVRDSSRCTVCSGRFGLVRYYSWQTAICSRKCAGRLRDRCESDRKWLAHALPVASPHAIVSINSRNIPRYVFS